MESAIKQLEAKLKKGQGHFTLNEASVITGISVDQAKDALEELIQKYVCRLQVTQNGDLIYDFGEKPRRRGRMSFGEIIKIVWEFAWNIFAFIFKVWIAFTLVIYFFISVFVIIALVIFFISKSSSDSDREGPDFSGAVTGTVSVMSRLILEVIFQVSGSLAQIFISLFRWKTNTDDTMQQKDPHGYNYKKYKPKSGIINPKKKNFVACVYDFVFGPKRVEIDPLNNEKEVAAYLKKQKGILVISELTGLAGWTLNQAQEFFTDCLIRFQGEVHVAENGVMYGEFDQALRGVGKAETGKIIWYWDEYEPEYEITGNSFARDVLIGLMNFVNLSVSFEIMRFWGFMKDIIVTGSDTLTYKILGFHSITIPPDLIAATDPETALFFYTYFGWIPLIFSILFFIIPLMRSVKYHRANKYRYQRNMHKRIFKAVYDFKGKPKTLQQYSDLINSNLQEQAIDKETLESILNEIALDLGGDTQVYENGELMYIFQRIADELETVKTLKEKKKTDIVLGDVIADSD